VNAQRIQQLCARAGILLLASAPSVVWPQTEPSSDDGDVAASNVTPLGRAFEQMRRIASGVPRVAAEAYDDYSNFKERVAKDSGLSWVVDVSYLQQWGLHGGGSPAGQILATPSFDWELFDDKTVGSGAVQLVYDLARYTTVQDAAAVQNRLGLITPINDYPRRQDIFAQLTYTHTFPGKRWLVGVGQYPIYNFDDNAYLNNQQINFNNYVLSQNGSATYPLAGLGAYAQFSPAPSVQFAAGLQNGSNVLAQTLAPQTAGAKTIAWFGYAEWAPKVDGLGPGRYSLLYYQAPTVPAQARTKGWSLNAVQQLSDRWAVFGRANRAYEFVTPVRASYALGIAMNNPLGRSATDQIACALGYSDTAPPPVNPPGARNEKILETYWTWTFGKGLLVTPAAQYILDPALNPSRSGVWILSLRTTLLF
jgi:porin